MYFENVFFLFERGILKMYFSEGAILKKCIFWGSNFEKMYFLKMYFFEGAILKMYFLNRILRGSSFENVSKKILKKSLKRLFKKVEKTWEKKF